MKFGCKVQGIPCVIVVISATPVIPARTSGPAENCYPEEGGEFEFEIQDRRGHRASWLAKKMTPKDEEFIYAEFLKQLKVND